MDNLIFYKSDAEHYNVENIIKLFVPNKVWDDVRKISKHKLLYGGWGTGKTILLKRLSWPAMLLESAYLNNQEFIAFYVDLREMEILNSIFLKEIFYSDESIRQYKSDLAIYFSSIFMLQAILTEIIKATNIIEANNIFFYPQLKIVREAFLNVINRILTPITSKKFSKIEAIDSFLSKEITDIISTISNPMILIDKIKKIPVFSSPDQIFKLFSLELKKKNKYKIGLLLDQYECLHADFQVVFNGLMQRMDSIYYFTIIACRPYKIIPFTLSGATITPIDSYDFLITEYFDYDSKEYKKLLSQIFSRLRKDNINIENILEGGLDYFTILSSRSIRLFLNLCDSAGCFEKKLISRALQEDTAKKVSGEFRDELKYLAGVPKESLWKLILDITKNYKSSDAGSFVEYPQVINITSKDLFGLESLTEKGKILLKKGFESGAFQFVNQKESSSLSIPEKFLIAPIIGPVLKGTFKKELEVKLEVSEIEEIAKGGFKMIPSKIFQQFKLIENIFLSISFEDLIEPNIVKDLFKEVFNEIDLKIITGKAIGPGMISQLFDQIKSTDCMIIELSYLRPNIILEMGLALGLYKRIIPVLNTGSNQKPDLSSYPFLLDMGIVNFTLQTKDLRKLRSEVIEWMQKPVNNSHLLITASFDRSHKLRVKKQKNTLGIYFPENRKSIWGNILPEIKRIASNSGYNYLIANEIPKKEGLTLFNSLVYVTSKSDKLLIDTSNEDSPDLYGAFGLGFAFALSLEQGRKKIYRLEEKNLDNREKLSMWPSEQYKIWENKDNLLFFIKGFLK